MVIAKNLLFQDEEQLALQLRNVIFISLLFKETT